jgi:hypothetical protein
MSDDSNMKANASGIFDGFGSSEIVLCFQKHTTTRQVPYECKKAPTSVINELAQRLATLASSQKTELNNIVTRKYLICSSINSMGSHAIMKAGTSWDKGIRLPLQQEKPPCHPL